MLDSIDRTLRRRTFLAGGPLLAGAGLLAASPSLGAAPASGEADLARAALDPEQNLRLYLKMNSDISGAPTYAWYSGHVFGVNQGDITRPLLGIEGFGQGRTVRQPDGTYKQSWKEVGYYKDLITGEIVEQWTNPYNGAQCDVMHINNRSVNLTFAPTVQPIVYPGGEASMGGGYTRAGASAAHPFTVPWFVTGDFVGVEMDARVTGTNPLDPAKWKRESSGPRYSVTEFFAQYGSLAELLDPKVSAVRSTGHWTRISPWLPWMLMGQAPGQCVLRCVTKKMAHYEDVPAHLRAHTAKHFPAFTYLSTPEEEALPLESSWEVFKMKRQPAPL